MIMETESLEICGSCKFEVEIYEDTSSYLTLEYTEHSSSYAHSDVETEIDIDKEKGAEIVAFLTKHLGL